MIAKYKHPNYSSILVTQSGLNLNCANMPLLPLDTSFVFPHVRISLLFNKIKKKSAVVFFNPMLQHATAVLGTRPTPEASVDVDPKAKRSPIRLGPEAPQELRVRC